MAVAAGAPPAMARPLTPPHVPPSLFAGPRARTGRRPLPLVLSTRFVLAACHRADGTRATAGPPPPLSRPQDDVAPEAELPPRLRFQGDGNTPSSSTSTDDAGDDSSKRTLLSQLALPEDAELDEETVAGLRSTLTVPPAEAQQQAIDENPAEHRAAVRVSLRVRFAFVLFLSSPRRHAKSAPPRTTACSHSHIYGPSTLPA